MSTFPETLMGFRINGTPIPDPTSWSGSISDLDIYGERDIKGTMHRKRVATKQPVRLNYVNISWDEAHDIVALTQGERLELRFMSLKTNKVELIGVYRGADVNYSVNMCFSGEFHNEKQCRVTLDISFIEY